MSYGPKRAMVVVLLICALVLAASGAGDKVLNWCGLGRLSQANTQYLDSAFEGALSGFLILSGIKSGLAIIEGSSVGVGVNIELGDVVQPVYDYVDVAWKAAMAGASIIVVMQLALQGLTLIDHWALALFFLFLTGWCVVGWIWPNQPGPRAMLKAASRFCASLCVVLYLLLPLTICGAALISERITGPLLKSSQAELKSLGDELAPDSLYQRFFPEGQGDEALSSFDLKGKLKKMGQGAKAFMAYMKLESERVAGLTLKLIAAYLFDCIVFPLFFGLILMTMIKSAVGRLFEIR